MKDETALPNGTKSFKLCQMAIVQFLPAKKSPTTSPSPWQNDFTCHGASPCERKPKKDIDSTHQLTYCSRSALKRQRNPIERLACIYPSAYQKPNSSFRTSISMENLSLTNCHLLNSYYLDPPNIIRDHTESQSPTGLIITKPKASHRICGMFMFGILKRKKYADCVNET